jgi:hypothetical protein
MMAIIAKYDIDHFLATALLCRNYVVSPSYLP